MDPILLTEFGDLLRRDLDSKVTDSDAVGAGLMWHNKTCNYVEPSPTDTHYRLVCGNCGTLLIVPKEVDTYGKLRHWCAKKIQEDQNREGRINDMLDSEIFLGE